jgi:Integrase core domain.
MDFIEQLPNSEGFTAILVVVDRLTKQAIFIPTHDTITSAQLAQLFVLHVFSKHGVPSHVTSDRGSEFVSHFFRSLGKALDMELHFTSGYHPEGDGRLNAPIRHSSNIFVSTAIINRTTGLRFFRSRNSPSIMLLALLPVFRHSSPTRAITQHYCPSGA